MEQESKLEWYSRIVVTCLFGAAMLFGLGTCVASCEHTSTCLYMKHAPERCKKAFGWP